MAKKIVEDTNVEVTPEDTERKAKQAEQRKSLADAKATLHDFMKSDVFAGLDDKVKEAITRLSKKAASTGTNSIMGFFTNLFPEVGTKLDEFELFKATKMGRAEMRKKVFYSWKNCEPSEKLWIRFLEAEEAWVLDAIGGDMPETWAPADLPKSMR